MTTKLEQAARQVIVDWDSGIHLHEAITALREALGYCVDEGCPHRETTHTCINPIAEQAEQKPVGKVLLHEGDVNAKGYLYNPLPEGTDLYAAPVRTKDLTDDEIWAEGSFLGLSENAIFAFARAVIAAYKEKNK